MGQRPAWFERPPVITFDERIDGKFCNRLRFVVRVLNPVAVLVSVIASLGHIGDAFQCRDRER
jgi:hypothetical protein